MAKDHTALDDKIALEDKVPGETKKNQYFGRLL